MSSMILMMALGLVLTFAIMFFLPQTNNLLGMGASTSSGVSDESIPNIDMGMDPERMIAETAFNNACGSSLLHGCPLSDFQNVYAQCKKIYGEISLEQCQEKCCKYQYNDTKPKNVSDVLNGAFDIMPPAPSLPSIG
jgi:hypothetical protein